MCALPGGQPDTAKDTIKTTEKPVSVIYFTDPICSSCWGIEPQLRKLKLQYGALIHIEYRMGGLLPDWSYNSGGISKPSDVAHHWDEVSGYYDMPIDGDVWLEDPLPSSYPPSIAFKAAQLQDEGKALLFLRAIREMVFLEKKNITRTEHLEAAALNCGLDLDRFRADYAGAAKTLFDADLNRARELGVRGFPTLFFSDGKGLQEKIYGTKPYTVFEEALKKVYPAATPVSYDTSWKGLFTRYASLTAREYAVLSGVPRDAAEQQLKQLAQEGRLKQYTTKNGSIWTIATGD